MIKKIIPIMLIIIISMLKVSFADDEIKLFYNDEPLFSDALPFMENSRTLVPVRVIMEAFGYEVSWDEGSETAVIESPDTTITLTKNSDTAYINGNKVIMDVKAQIVVGRIFVPIRFVSENFGYNVYWNDEVKCVYIADKPKEPELFSEEEEPSETVLVREFTPVPMSENDVLIRYIIVEKLENRIRLIVSGDKTLPAPRVSTLANPSRHVLDFDNAVLGGSFTEQYGVSHYVENVRFAQNNISPNVVRVVLDLKENVNLTVSTISNAYVLDITPEVVVSSLRPNYDADMSKKLVVLDPGHGGNESGAKGYYEGRAILEKDVNLYIGQKVFEILQNDGINVISTRLTDKDVTLQERAEIANRANATLFVSIHNNAFDSPDAKGTLTLYAYDEPKENQVISDYQVAKIMQAELIKGTGGYNRNLLRNPNIYVTRATKMPALLCECLFMTNSEDLKVLVNNERLDKIAQSIADGVKNCLEVMPLIEATY